MEASAHQIVRAFAPGGIGNLGPGLDILGCAVEGPGDTVTARRVATPGVTIEDPGHAELPTDATRHASGIAALEVLRRAGDTVSGMVLRIEKGLPFAGGQGGSAASSVAGAFAANQLLGTPLSTMGVLESALLAEGTVSGRHADNVAPSLLGGIVLVRSMEPLDVVRLPVPDGLRIVLVLPDYRVHTADARRVLPAQVDRATAIYQAAQVGALVAALHSGDLQLLARAVDDRIAEPARASLLPGFAEAKRAALDAGAAGCSVSGAGPTCFAFSASESDGARIGAAMVAAYGKVGVVARARVVLVDMRGARLV